MTAAPGNAPTLAHRAARAAWWSALEIGTRQGIQLLVMIILARLLTPTDFGLVAMLLVFTTIAAVLVDGGFSAALVQQQRSSDDDETTVFLSCLAVAIAAAAILYIAAPLIASFYSQPALTELLRLALFALPLGALAAVPDARLTQRLDFRSRTNAEVVASLLSGTLAVFLAWKGFGAWSLTWQAIASIGLRAILLWRFARWRPRGRFRVESFRRLFAFGGYLLLYTLLASTYMRLQALLIGRLFDSRTLGYYTLAQNTQQAPAQFMGNLLNRVGLPVFSMVAGQPAKLVAALRMTLRVALFFFVPCMAGVAVFSTPLVSILYGKQWEPAAPFLSLLALSAALWPMQVLNMAALSAQGRSDLVFRLEVVKRGISISLILVCSPFGPLAIAWAVLIASLVGVAINTWYTHKLFEYSLTAQLYDQGSTLLLSTLAALTGWLTLRFMPPEMISILLAVAFPAIVYIGGATLTKHRALADVATLMRDFRSRQTPPAPAPGIDA